MGEEDKRGWNRLAAKENKKRETSRRSSQDSGLPLYFMEPIQPERLFSDSTPQCPPSTQKDSHSNLLQTVPRVSRHVSLLSVFPDKLTVVMIGVM